MSSNYTWIPDEKYKGYLLGRDTVVVVQMFVFHVQELGLGNLDEWFQKLYRMRST